MSRLWVAVGLLALTGVQALASNWFRLFVWIMLAKERQEEAKRAAIERDACKVGLAVASQIHAGLDRATRHEAPTTVTGPTYPMCNA